MSSSFFGLVFSLTLTRRFLSLLYSSVLEEINKLPQHALNFKYEKISVFWVPPPIVLEDKPAHFSTVLPLSDYCPDS